MEGIDEYVTPTHQYLHTLSQFLLDLLVHLLINLPLLQRISKPGGPFQEPRFGLLQIGLIY